MTGVPGRYITLMDRMSYDNNETFQFTGTYTTTLNMSSYNYLGFAQSSGPCADDVHACISAYGISSTSPRLEVGTSDLTVEVEREIANFVGKEDAMVFSMGFCTNATSFPALVGPGCLIISDELNHASIRVGARLSGAAIESYKHNDMDDLEKVLKKQICDKQPRTHKPWQKILVVCEGLFSMEGTIADLPGLIRLRKKYKFYLFVDEAHSIGALGYVLLFCVFFSCLTLALVLVAEVSAITSTSTPQKSIFSWELSQKRSEQMVAMLQLIKPLFKNYGKRTQRCITANLLPLPY
jgi:serine palmitoyltransferase